MNTWHIILLWFIRLKIQFDWTDWHAYDIIWYFHSCRLYMYLTVYHTPGYLNYSDKDNGNKLLLICVISISILMYIYIYKSFTHWRIVDTGICWKLKQDLHCLNTVFQVHMQVTAVLLGFLILKISPRVIYSSINKKKQQPSHAICYNYTVHDVFDN